MHFNVPLKASGGEPYILLDSQSCPHLRLHAQTGLVTYSPLETQRVTHLHLLHRIGLELLAL